MNRNADLKTSKAINTKLVYFFWTLTLVLAVVLGSIITNKILYASSSLALKAKVHSKVTHRERSAHSKSYSSALKIIYQY
jgi:hypothetical protein